MDAETLAFLTLRAAVAYVILYAAYMNTRDAAAWQWTVTHTAILFRGTALEKRQDIIKLCALIGMVIMYGGGLSVLLGLEIRAGSAALAGFTFLGAIIHNREKQMALDMGEQLKPAVSESATPVLVELMWSGFAGHHSSALKNWALIGAFLFFVLLGAGPDSVTVSDAIGAWFRK